MLIPAGNPSLWTGPTGTNTYLLTGRVPALIDAGVGHATHVDAVADGLGGRDLELVLLTHSHSDHASGVPAIMERWPRAVVRPTAEAFVDGASIIAGDRTLTALHTPGHAPDHFCFLDGDLGEVYCGDLLRAGGTIVIPGSRGGDLRAYLASLRRIRDLRPKRLWPGHGGVIDTPDAIIAEYLAHRAEREEQIVGALRRGLATPLEIAVEVYGKLPAVIKPAAADSVLAHLQKLVADGRVEIADGRYELRD